MEKNISIHNLAVLDILAEGLNQTVGNWRRNKNIPKAESCARQVWFGHEDDFQDFPFKKVSRCHLNYREGAEAYEYMLRLVLGMRSKNYAESHIAGQFYRGWQELHRDHPDIAKPYDGLMQGFTADSRLIRGRILSGFQTPRHERIAVDLSGMVNNENILIIGAAGKPNGMSQLTDGIARVASSNGNRKAREVSIMHHDKDVLKSLNQALVGLKKKSIICGNATSCEFSEINLAFEVYDQVFVTLPMGQNPEIDEQIISAWKNRSATDNKMTHIGLNGLMNEHWEGANLDNFISPNDIYDEMKARKENNKIVNDLANEAIELCVNMRSEGIQPSHRKLVDHMPKLA